MDRDDCREMEERICIRDTGRTHKKYGSTSKHMTRTENLVKHNVTESDTLQGIALKYGVTTEQIRRVNKLWATDSLFLREFLLIPVSPDKNLLHLKDDQTSGDQEMITVTMSSSSSISSSIDEDNSPNDFLAKMDSSIASVKKDVKRVQGNSKFCSEGDNTYIQRQKPCRTRNSLPSSLSSVDSLRPSSSSDIPHFPTAVTMTQGKKVKTSLQRLEQEQDEMFQL